MVEQDGWEPHEMQPELLLPIPSGPRAHYRRLQEFMRPSGSTGLKREVEVAVAPF